MSLEKIFSLINNQGMLGWSVVVMILLSLVEITPIKLNPWSAIIKWFRAPLKIGTKIEQLSARFDEVDEKIEKVDNKIESLEQDMIQRFRDNEDQAEKKNAIQVRVRILRFGDEISHGVKLSKEHFEQIIQDIDTYEDYCERHPEFENSITIQNAHLIKKKYEEGLDDPSIFLTTH